MEENVKQNKFKKFLSAVGTYVRGHVSDVASYAGLALCLIVFTITSSGRLWSNYNISVLLESVCVYMIVALGALFVYSMGYMDISVGAQLGVYCLLLIFITNATGSLLLGFVAILALTLLCGAFNGFVAVWLKLPSIVTSLFLMFLFGGIQLLMVESTGDLNVFIDTEKADLSIFLEPWVIFATIVVVAAIVFYLFNYTKLGKYTRAIGANELTTKECGVNTTKWKVIAYMVFGVCVAIGAVFLLARTGSAGRSTGSSYAMDVMLSLILGGMPLSGGMKSKVRCALIGSFTYALLSNGLTLSGVDPSLVYLVKAIIFFIVVALSCRDRSGYLPR